MSKRAYVASVTIEIVVVAESEASARTLAAKAYRDEYVNDGDFELGSLSYLPANYELESLVHHDGQGDLEVREAVKLPGGYLHVPPPPAAP